MAALLVVLVVVCALGIAVHLARGLWARTRSVHRHQQALDTLADITQSTGGTAPAGALDSSQHQAHVRVLGPSGEPSPTEVPVLPPPKPLAPNEHASQSPFRRPSRSGLRSGAGAQAALAGGTNSLHMRPITPPPVAPPITPPDGPIGGDELPLEDVTRAIPGLTPPPPPKAPDEPTRPVPVIRPHVFYFDDLSARSNQAKGSASAKAAGAGGEALAPSDPTAAVPGAASPSTAAKQRGTSRQRRLAAQALVAASVALVVAGGAVYLAVEGSGQSPGRVGAPKTSNPVASTGGPSTAASTSPPASTNQPTSSSSTSTTVTTLPKPVQLISSVKNATTGTTDTYRLTSSTASIVVKAAGPCWVEVRVGGPAGQVKVEETLQAGEQATVSGAAWIRLGDPPYASVLVDGTPTTVPGAKSGVPLNLNFTIS